MSPKQLGAAGVQLKIETNGQRFDAKIAERLARLPIRSVQISLDADSEEVYRRQRPGGSLAKAHAACRAVRAASLPLEITFAPTRLNIDEIEAVIERARALGAFRFNTGKLMRIGTAARLWDKLEPSDEQYRRMLDVLQRQAEAIEGSMELCYVPFTIEDGLRRSLQEPAGDDACAAEWAGQGRGGASSCVCRLATPDPRASVGRLPQRLAG